MTAPAIGRGTLAVLTAALLTSTALPALAQPEAPAGGVTSERILNAADEPQNWLTNHLNYSSTRYSLLDQVNRDNVGDLEFAFSVALAPNEGNAARPYGALQATPLVDDGIMYMTDGWGRIYKIDVRSGTRGTILWQMDPAVDKEFLQGPINNRGVALWQDKAISVARDGRILATDLESGEVVWEETVRTTPGEYFTVAPLTIKDTVVYGAAGGETGSRDWLEARDADTGAQIWRTYTIPAPGEPNSETWADNWNAYETGGGSIWVTGSYDPDTNITIWGTGNPSPDYDPEYRPGDNLYTNSALALDADSGEIKWWFQYTPNDSWDFDEVGSHILIDAEVGGEPRKMVVHVARNGFSYELDRTTGAFIQGAKYVDELNWTEGLDPKTGMPVEYNPELDVQTYVPSARISRESGPVQNVCPNIQGGTNFFPTAYNPVTNRVYLGSIEGCSNIKNEVMVAGATPQGGRWAGGAADRAGLVQAGSIKGIDVTTGEVAVSRHLPFPQYSGVLATAGQLIFSGQLDGEFEAMDADTLEVLWRTNLGSTIDAPPMSYAVDDKQYVVIPVGGGYIGAGYLPQGETPELAQNVQQSSTLYFFTLDQ